MFHQGKIREKKIRLALTYILVSEATKCHSVCSDTVILKKSTFDFDVLMLLEINLQKYTQVKCHGYTYMNLPAD